HREVRGTIEHRHWMMPKPSAVVDPLPFRSHEGLQLGKNGGAVSAGGGDANQVARATHRNESLAGMRMSLDHAELKRKWLRLGAKDRQIRSRPFTLIGEACGEIVALGGSLIRARSSRVRNHQDFTERCKGFGGKRFHLENARHQDPRYVLKPKGL